MRKRTIPTRQRRILVDLDGIVCDTLDYWLEKIAKASGVRALVTDIDRWELEKCPPLDRVDRKIIFGVLNAPGFMRGAPKMTGAVEALKRLNVGGDLYLVTARHGENSMPETLEWCEEHLPFLDARRQTIFAYDKHIIDADVLVDDRAETLEEYHSHHPSALCVGLRYPYNERLRSLFDGGKPQYQLVDSWRAIERCIKQHLR